MSRSLAHSPPVCPLFASPLLPSAAAQAAGGGSGFAFVPGFPLDRLFPGVFYLEGIGADRVRAYGRRPTDAPRARGGALAPSLVAKAAAAAAAASGEGDSGDKAEEAATTATTVSATGTSNSGEDEEEEEARETGTGAGTAGNGGGVGVGNGVVAPARVAAAVAEAPSSDSSLVNGAATKTAAAAAAASAEATDKPPAPPLSCSASSGARIGATLPRVVVTGVACGLPGQEEVFEQDNLARLLGGQGCFQRLSAGSTAALVEKNVVQVSRAKPSRAGRDDRCNRLK